MKIDCKQTVSAETFFVQSQPERRPAVSSEWSERVWTTPPQVTRHREHPISTGHTLCVQSDSPSLRRGTRDRAKFSISVQRGFITIIVSGRVPSRTDRLEHSSKTCGYDVRPSLANFGTTSRPAILLYRRPQARTRRTLPSLKGDEKGILQSAKYKWSVLRKIANIPHTVTLTSNQIFTGAAQPTQQNQVASVQ